MKTRSKIILQKKRATIRQSKSKPKKSKSRKKVSYQEKKSSKTIKNTLQQNKSKNSKKSIQCSLSKQKQQEKQNIYENKNIKTKSITSQKTDYLQDDFSNSNEDNQQQNYHVLCRQQQQNQLKDFCVKALLEKCNNNTLYVSGVPGVGKTTTVLKTLQKFKKQTFKIDFHYINGMKLKKPKDVYDLIIQILQQSEKVTLIKHKKSQAVSQLEKLILKLKIHHFMVIDEVDYLMTKDQSVYYNLFDWAFNNSKFSIIAIGNTLDFSKRLSAKIGSRIGNNVLVFKPYSQKQLFKIVNQRVSKSDLYEQAAMVYASKKMATFTSDIRKIIQVLKRAEQQIKTKQEKSKKRIKQKISIEDISRLWQQLSRTFQKRQDYLCQLYRQIIQILKQSKGKINCQQIINKLRLKQILIKKSQLIFGIVQLQQMGLVKYDEGIINATQTIYVSYIK